MTEIELYIKFVEEKKEEDLMQYSRKKLNYEWPLSQIMP